MSVVTLVSQCSSYSKDKYSLNKPHPCCRYCHCVGVVLSNCLCMCVGETERNGGMKLNHTTLFIDKPWVWQF